jgi:DNA-binding NtrC family response regulator
MTMRVMFVEDDDTFRSVLTRELNDAGFVVEGHATGRAALDALRTSQPEVLLLDLNLPDVEGLELLEQIRARCAAPVVFLTGRGGVKEAVEAIKLGAYDFLVKPAPLETIEETLRRAVASAASAPSLPTLKVDELEEHALLAALERCAGDKRQAAAEMGVSLRTLYNMLDRFGHKQRFLRQR